VETLRSIAEILIWGDQNDSSVFDFFLERNMLSYFLKIMDQKTGSNYVCVQLLQTLNILFENIRNETSIYYLLSNNHVNSIIIHKFDFSDEEVMAYFISFLKTLSFRLNQHTIHFFYNEHTNDFPLYTEAIKFFNHSESMVRIAVRTLSLNVYKVEDAAMLKFVTDKTAAPYFSNLVWFIGNHILEIDDCVRNDADHKSLNRLKDLVAEHLDHLHYLNDILNLNIDSLNRILTDHLLNRLFIPLYIYSFARLNMAVKEDMKPHVSPVVGLFLLCQVFLIISHVPLVRLLAWILVAGDHDVFTERGATLYATSPRHTKIVKPSFMAPPDSLDKLLARNIKRTANEDTSDSEGEQEPSAASSSICELTKLPSPFHLPVPKVEERECLYPNDLSITDEEKELRLSGANVSLEKRPFLSALFTALEYCDNDYYQLFSLCLIYAMQVNSGINRELLESIQVPGKHSSPSTSPVYNRLLVEKMLKLANASCQYGSRVRLVTLEILIISMRMIVLRENRSLLIDEHLAALEGAREESTLILRNFYKSEEIFLDMFEDEYREMHKRPINVEFVMSDASLLLPPTGTPLTGIDFRKRLPCGEVERARKAIRTFFLLRELSLSLQGLKETCLPLSDPDSCVLPGVVLDLNNSDLLAVTVVLKDGTRQRRFLVVDLMQIILIEPDSTRLGWGVAKFSGFLQDLEVTSDKDDSRCLHVTVHKPSSNGHKGGTPVPLLAATFTFDDHIRCMAAKQRLTKGRSKARQRKMHLIASLLELPSSVGAACPSPLVQPAGGGTSPVPGSSQSTLASLRQAGHRQRRQTHTANRLTASSQESGQTGGYRPLFSSVNSRVPGAAAPVSSSSSRQQRRDTSSSPAEQALQMESLGGSARESDCEEALVTTTGRESETSFETAAEVESRKPTWYLEVDEESQESPRGRIQDL